MPELLYSSAVIAVDSAAAPVALTAELTVPAGADRLLVALYACYAATEGVPDGLDVALDGEALEAEHVSTLNTGERDLTFGIATLRLTGALELTADITLDSVADFTGRAAAQVFVLSGVTAETFTIELALSEPGDSPTLALPSVPAGACVLTAAGSSVSADGFVTFADGSASVLFANDDWGITSGGSAGALILDAPAALAPTWNVIGVDGALAAVSLVIPGPSQLGASVNCECVDEHPGRTLLDLRTSLLRRLGFSAQVTNPPPGMAALLDDFLRDAQAQLYERATAMRTERYFRWTMTPGVRFYGLRANEGPCDLRLDPYKISWVGIEDTANTWAPLYAGIHPGHYTSLQRGRPTRYEVRQCIEVFPPPDAAYVLRVKGHFGLSPLVADTDQTTLPSHAVFLLALGNAKAHYGQADAGNYFGQANSFVGGQVAGSHLTRRYVPGAGPAVPWTRPKIIGGDDE